MENQYCYIEFDFTNERNFKDLKETFEVIKNSKNNSIERDDTFWLEKIKDKWVVDKIEDAWIE